MSADELSPERVGRITGSRIAKILGLSPYGDAESVMREMVRDYFGDPVEFTGNWATEHGEATEDLAVTAYEDRYGVLVHSGGLFVPHPDIDWLGVTPDGLVGDNGLLETKCPPPRARYTRVDERPDYEAQILLQMECTQREWGHLGVYKDDPRLRPEDRLFVSRVDYDPLWLPSKMDTLEAFKERFEKIIENEAKAAPFRQPLRLDRDDLEFLDAELDYADAKATLAAAEAEVAARKARLVELANGKTTRGRFYQVTYPTKPKKGSVDWQKFVQSEAPGADPEKYRKDDTPVSDLTPSINPVGSKS